MATYCPKCNYKLKLTDWRPECPQCGINLNYYGMEERLRAEADKAEYEHAITQPKIDRVKAATIGTTLSKVRLGLYLLPILATLLPLGKIVLDIPFSGKATTVNVISIVKVVMDLDFGAFTSMFGGAVFGKDFLFLFIALAAFLLMLVIALVSLVMLILSCSPKGVPRNIAFNIVGIALAVTSAITFNIAASNFSAAIPSLCQASIGWGIFGIVLAFCICLGTNIMHAVKGIEVKYKDVSELLMPYDERPSVIAAKAEKEEAERLAEKETVTAASGNPTREEPLES